MGTFIVVALLLDFIVIILIIEKIRTNKIKRNIWIVVTLLIPYIGALIAIDIMFLRNKKKRKDSIGRKSANCSIDGSLSEFFDGDLDLGE